LNIDKKRGFAAGELLADWEKFTVRPRSLPMQPSSFHGRDRWHYRLRPRNPKVAARQQCHSQKWAGKDNKTQSDSGLFHDQVLQARGATVWRRIRF